MKKIALAVVLVIATVVLINLPSIVNFYLKYFYYDQKCGDRLSNTNSAIQIGYNIIYLLVAFLVLYVANDQLNKTREATTIQTLSNIDNYLKSDDFLRKRKKLATYVLLNGIDDLSQKLENLKNKTEKLSDPDSKEIAILKNTFEDVLYQFEFIGYYYTKGIFSIKDVYQLFSIEIQQYWLLMEKLKFIKYLRENKLNPITEYYDKFEILFKDTLDQEVKSELPVFLKFFYIRKLYKERLARLIKIKKASVDQFLNEEKYLID